MLEENNCFLCWNSIINEIIFKKMENSVSADKENLFLGYLF